MLRNTTFDFSTILINELNNCKVAVVFPCMCVCVCVCVCVSVVGLVRWQFFPLSSNLKQQMNKMKM